MSHKIAQQIFIYSTLTIEKEVKKNEKEIG